MKKLALLLALLDLLCVCTIFAGLGLAIWTSDPQATNWGLTGLLAILPAFALSIALCFAVAESFDG